MIPTLRYKWSPRLVGKVQNLPKEEGSEGGDKKACAAHPREPGLEPGTCRVLGEGPQLHAGGGGGGAV